MIDVCLNFQCQAISDLGMDSATPKSGAPAARVTSAVRKSGGVAYPSVSATPGGAGTTPPHVLLLTSTASIFETLESHQVRESAETVLSLSRGCLRSLYEMGHKRSSLKALYNLCSSPSKVWKVRWRLLPLRMSCTSGTSSCRPLRQF